MGMAVFLLILAGIVVTDLIPIALGGIIEAICELLPTLLETATSLFTQVLETLLSLLPELIPFAG